MPRDVPNYSELDELFDYLRRNFAEKFNKFENRVERTIVVVEKAAVLGGPSGEMLLQKWGPGDDPEIVAALRNREEFKQQVCDRILAAQSSEIFINRCGICLRIVASPRARQCLWCAHDWH